MPPKSARPDTLRASVHRMASVAWLFWLAAAVVAVMAPVVAAQQPRPLDGDFPLEGLPEQLSPLRERTWQEEDRVESSALFAEGRLLFQRQDYGGALRKYQRAWRRAPEETPILHEIVPLAFALGRETEAARYAVIAAEQSPMQPGLLIRLGMHLAEQEQWERAAQLYEQALRLEPAPTPATFSLQLDLGRIYLLLEQPERAAEAMDRVRKALDDPASHGLDERLLRRLLQEPETALTLVAEVFLQADRLDDAEEYFRRAHEASAAAGSSSLLDVHLARASARREQWDQVREHIERHLERGEADLSGLELLEQALGELHDQPPLVRERLQARLVSFLDEHPDDLAAGYFLAGKLLEWGELDEAGERFAALLETSPAAEAYVGLIRVSRQREDVPRLANVLGRLVVDAGNLDLAGDELEELAASDELAAALYAQVLDGDAPADVEGEANRPLAAAYLAAERGDWERADLLLERAVDKPQPAREAMLFEWGNRLLARDQYARAAAAFRRAIDAGPARERLHLFYFQLAAALALADDTEPAVEAAERAAALAPDAARIQLRLPWILFFARDHARAGEKLGALIERFDDRHDSKDIRDVVRQARLMSSSVAIEFGRMAEAEEWLEQVLDEFPEDPTALNDLGYLWADQAKRLHRALEMTRRAVEADPDNRAYRDSLGWAHYRLGNFEMAVRELERAAEGGDPDPVILDHLGDAYDKTGQRQRALDAWQQALELFDKADRQQEADKVRGKLQAEPADERSGSEGQER